MGGDRVFVNTMLQLFFLLMILAGVSFVFSPAAKPFSRPEEDNFDESLSIDSGDGTMQVVVVSASQLLRINSRAVSDLSLLIPVMLEQIREYLEMRKVVHDSDSISVARGTVLELEDLGIHTQVCNRDDGHIVAVAYDMDDCAKEKNGACLKLYPDKGVVRFAMTQQPNSAKRQSVYMQKVGDGNFCSGYPLFKELKMHRSKGTIVNDEQFDKLAKSFDDRSSSHGAR